MKFPALFRREKSVLAQREAKQRAEKLLADSLRSMAQVFGKLADFVDAQRLSRAGFEEQEKFLERLDGDVPPKG